MVQGRLVMVEGQVIKPAELEWREYRKRPVVVTATRMEVPFRVATLEGWMEGQKGDWLIEGVEGELYPCKDRIFRATYEVVEDAEDPPGFGKPEGSGR